MKRAGTSEEMANVIAFLASDEASFMTGSIVVADGGVLCAKTIRNGIGTVKRLEIMNLLTVVSIFYVVCDCTDENVFTTIGA